MTLDALAGWTSWFFGLSKHPAQSGQKCLRFCKRSQHQPTNRDVTTSGYSGQQQFPKLFWGDQKVCQTVANGSGHFVRLVNGGLNSAAQDTVDVRDAGLAFVGEFALANPLGVQCGTKVHAEVTIGGQC